MTNKADIDTMEKTKNSTMIDEDDETELRSVLERVDNLESSVKNITEQQADLSHSLAHQSDKLSELESSVKKLRENLESLEKEININSSRLNGVSNNLDMIEESASDIIGDIDSLESRMTKRLRMLEDTLNMNGDESLPSIPDNANQMDKLASLPEESRKEQFNVRVQRAIAIYERFHELSEPVAGGGKRLLSRDIKTFLNGYSNSKIRYSQVQRVIDSFDEKTDDSYSVKQTNDGRAIFWDKQK